MNKNICCDRYGKFKDELSNRFMADVIIDNEKVTCYVKSSSRLGNYLDLKNKTILLKKNKNSRFEYFIYAVKHKRSAILLCPSEANEIVFESMNRSVFSFLGRRTKRIQEFKIDNYKSDIYIPETKSFIEIKSIISYDENVKFPTVHSERFENQLMCFDKLLSLHKGYLFLVCLNPYCKSISINSDSEDYSLLRKEIDNGLIVKGFSIDFIKGKPIIKKEIPIII